MNQKKMQDRETSCRLLVGKQVGNMVFEATQTVGIESKISIYYVSEILIKQYLSLDNNMLILSILFKSKHFSKMTLDVIWALQDEKRNGNSIYKSTDYKRDNNA